MPLPDTQGVPPVRRWRWPLRARTRGGAALEFMLVLPIVLLVLVGMLALSNFLSTRYFLTASAIHAARVCTVARMTNRPCAEAAVNQYLQGPIRNRCAALTTTAAVTRLPGTSVDVFAVNVQCTYSVDMGGTLLTNQGIQLTTLQGKGSMPVQ